MCSNMSRVHFGLRGFRCPTRSHRRAVTTPPCYILLGTVDEDVQTIRHGTF